MNVFERHVALANKALEAYSPAPEWWDCDMETDDPQAVLTDLLADLMHWADSIEGVDFLDARQDGENHYLYEYFHPEEETPWAHKD
jgi:hypothetical protein